MIRQLLFSVILLIPSLLMANSKDSINNYRIYDVKQQKEIDLETLLKSLADEQVVFFGEEHNDPTAHQLELAIFQGLHQQAGQRLVMTMEMFHTDVQTIMDEYLQGLINDKNFEKEGRIWNNYADYRPLVQYARDNGIPVIGANAASRYSNRVTRLGLASLDSLSETAKKWIAPLPIDTLTGAYYEKFADLLGGHEGMGNMKLYQSQNLWDATMAWSIGRALDSKKDAQVYQVNGRFHSDEKLGTAGHLLRARPDVRLANISCFSDASIEDITPRWEKWEKLGDYIIITDPELERTFQ